MTCTKQTAHTQSRGDARPASFGGWAGIKMVGRRTPDPAELH